MPSLNDNGDHVGGVTGFLKSLAWTIRQFKPTRCIIVFDGSGGSTRRRKLFPDYKANRINKSSFNRYNEFSSKELEEESMQKQMGRLIQYLNELPISVISIDMIEADDVIAYLTTDVCKKNVTIVSTDKDYLQLINDRVKVWRPTTKQLFDQDTIINEYGILPSNFLLYRLFEGDSSDNIPGIKGVGLKTLIKEFPQLLTEDNIDYNQLITLCKRIVTINKSPKKIHKTILESESILDINYKLMQLSNVDIPAEYKKRIRDIFNSVPKKINHYNIRKYFAEDLFNMVIKDADSWLRNSFSCLEQHAI